MATGKGKKLVYISEDLLDKAAKVSRAEGVSLSKLIEGAVNEAVKVNELGYSSKQMAEFFNLLQTNRVLGGLFVPSGVLDYMIGKTFKDDAQQLQELWYESGRWNGKYLKEKFSDPVAAFRDFLGLSRWDLNEVDVKADSNTVKVRCISTILSIEGTQLLARFIEGILNGMDYSTTKNSSLKGMIIIEFKK